ncbi:RNA polymerase II elongation factor ELL2-like isoform X3 [Passer domesticus]|uniref:RNA polymerase II elongation factor ELL2-like isoform X3 n=1 Tax=Passer domesticus TaxID=48849 RepID=UPI0030FE27E7
MYPGFYPVCFNAAILSAELGKVLLWLQQSSFPSLSSTPKLLVGTCALLCSVLLVWRSPLLAVANLDANENSFSLKEHFFKDIQEDWPGYTERDRQTLEVTLSRKPTPSQNATSTSQSPSLGPSEGDTPLRTAQKRPLASDFLSPVMGKKQRIDQEPSDVQPAAGGHSPSFLDLPSTSCSTFNPSPIVRLISTSTPEEQQKNKFQTHSGFPVSARVQGKTPKSKGEEAEVRGAQQNNPGPVPEKKRMVPVRLADIDWSGCAAVYGRPYRDRVIHLLALRDYKEPELLARLQRDGVRPKDKDSLGNILQQVANLNAKENSFSLKEHLFQTLQTDWPGYSKIERKSLKLILSRKSAPSQNSTSSSQATSPRPSETDAPARPAQVFCAFLTFCTVYYILADLLVM